MNESVADIEVTDEELERVSQAMQGVPDHVLLALDRELARENWARDVSGFGRQYLAHHLKQKIPNYHRLIYSEIETLIWNARREGSDSRTHAAGPPPPRVDKRSLNPAQNFTRIFQASQNRSAGRSAK